MSKSLTVKTRSKYKHRCYVMIPVHNLAAIEVKTGEGEDDDDKGQSSRRRSIEAMAVFILHATVGLPTVGRAVV